MPHWQRIVLIAAGAGGGIAATFNTPVGGLLFAIEIMMNEISVRTLVPVAISTATATYVGRVVFGPSPSFIIPRFEIPFFHVTEPAILLSYVGLGLLMGLISALFIKSIYGFEDFFDKRIRGSYYRRHLLGMLAVGVMLYTTFTLFGHYYIQGVGYATIQDILTGANLSMGFLLLLAVLKLVATSLTLGSGASGGYSLRHSSWGPRWGAPMGSCSANSSRPFPSARRPSPWLGWRAPSAAPRGRRLPLS